MCRDDLTRFHILIERSDAFKQFRRTVDVTVGQSGLRQILHILFNVFPCKLQELLYGKGIDAGLCKVVFALGLPLVHPLFYFECFDLHFILRLSAALPSALLYHTVPAFEKYPFIMLPKRSWQ